MDSNYCYTCNRELRTDEEIEAGMCAYCLAADALEEEVVGKYKEPKPTRGVWR